MGQAIQGDVTILRNHLRDLAHHLQEGAVVIALAQQRKHIASETTHLAVRKNGLEAVTDFGPVLVVTDGKQDHYATVGPLVPDAPLLKKMIGEVFHRVTFQGLDGDHGDLRLGLLIDFRTEPRESFHRRRVEHAGKIVDVALDVELLPLLRVDWRNGNESEEYEDRDRKWAENGVTSEVGE